MAGEREEGRSSQAMRRRESYTKQGRVTIHTLPGSMGEGKTPSPPHLHLNVLHTHVVFKKVKGSSLTSESVKYKGKNIVLHPTRASRVDTVDGEWMHVD